MRVWTLGLGWTGAAAAVAAFWLPWASLAVREPSLMQGARRSAASPDGLLGGLGDELGRVTATIRRGAQTVSGELPRLGELPSTVRGVDIPRLARDERARTAVALLEMVTGTSQHLGAKAAAVYLVPALAVLGAWLLTRWSRRRALALAVAASCAGVAGFGLVRVLTTNLSTSVVSITIGPGVWLSLAAYGALALCAWSLGAGQTRRMGRSTG